MVGKWRDLALYVHPVKATKTKKGILEITVNWSSFAVICRSFCILRVC
jgi:hypothetical protein